MVGEHIRALRDGRWEHAIDCGDETVIHLAEDGAGPARVRRSYRPEFVARAEAVEVVRHRERTFPASEVVARAYSRASDPGLATIFRDSEAFAGWCVTGRLPAAPPRRAGAPAGAGSQGAASGPTAPTAPAAPAAPATTPRAARAERPQVKGARRANEAPTVKAKAKAKRAAAARSPERRAPKATTAAKGRARGTRPAARGENGAKPARSRGAPARRRPAKAAPKRSRGGRAPRRR